MFTAYFVACKDAQTIMCRLKYCKTSMIFVHMIHVHIQELIQKVNLACKKCNLARTIAIS